MKRYNHFGLILMLLLVILSGCKLTSSYPEAKITIKVIDEHGQPIKDAEVGLGFENGYYNDQPRMVTKAGLSDSNGKFVAKSTTSNYVSYGAIKNGYYRTTNEYSYIQKKSGRWEPWNPEITVVLRKIENPVPMYARQITDLMIPVMNKSIGFDLIESDWVKPYGRGKFSDFNFKMVSSYTNHLEFDGKLIVSTQGEADGLILVKEKQMYGSELKLPRFATNEGYARIITKTSSRLLGKPLSTNIEDDSNYIFRVRSSQKDGTVHKAFYGKIRGDFKFLFDAEKASISFTYYLNPDYTNNLEFDIKRNLFMNLPEMQKVRLP